MTICLKQRCSFTFFYTRATSGRTVSHCNWQSVLQIQRGESHQMAVQIALYEHVFVLWCLYKLGILGSKGRYSPSRVYVQVCTLGYIQPFANEAWTKHLRAEWKGPIWEDDLVIFVNIGPATEEHLCVCVCVSVSTCVCGTHAIICLNINSLLLGGANGKTKARLANRGWFDDLKHI